MPNAAATALEWRRTPVGARVRHSSAIVAGRNTRGTQLTHARWVVSGRCSAWGMIPRLNMPTANRTRGIQAPGSLRIRHTPVPIVRAISSGSMKNHRNTCCGAPNAGSDQPGTRSTATFWSAPAKSSHAGGTGIDRPGRRPEHGVEQHALDRVARTGGDQLDQVGRDADGQPEAPAEEPACARGPRGPRRSRG